MISKSNRRIVGVFLCLFCFMIFFSISTSAEESNKKEQEMIYLDKLKKRTNFDLLLSEQIPEDWNLEVKHPLKISDTVDFVQLNYLDKTNTIMKFALMEKKAKNNFNELEDFGENVKINDEIGVFRKLSPTEKFKDVKGGTLSWVQDGTLITMFSSRLSKNEMLKIAESMKKYN